MPSDYDNGGLNLEALRIGQRGAVSTIVNRVREREPYTAIVLPTRYGKTDVMRVAGMQLLYSGHISRALILVPNEFLRDNAFLDISGMKQLIATVFLTCQGEFQLTSPNVRPVFRFPHRTRLLSP